MLRSPKKETLGKGDFSRRAVLLCAALLVLLCARNNRIFQPSYLVASHVAIGNVHQERGQCFDDDDGTTWAASTRTFALVRPACWYRPFASETVSLPRLQLTGFHYNRPPPS